MDEITTPRTIDTDAVRVKTDEMETYKNQIAQILEQVKTEITTLAGVWEGPSSDEFQRRFGLISGDMETMLSGITEHMHYIREAAQIDMQPYRPAKPSAEGLSADVKPSGAKK